MTTTAPDTTLPTTADALLARLASQELDRIPEMFEPDADLRALLPGGLVIGEGADDIAAMFTEWFGDTEEYALVGHDAAPIGARLHLMWRVRLRADRFGHGPKLVEQHGYATLAPGGRIRTLSLVCSGYCRAADGE